MVIAIMCIVVMTSCTAHREELKGKEAVIVYEYTYLHETPDANKSSRMETKYKNQTLKLTGNVSNDIFGDPEFYEVYYHFVNTDGIEDAVTGWIFGEAIRIK